MENTKIKFLYLSEPDMIKAGVTDMGKCVETMEEVLKLLSAGDYVMGGSNHNSHGVAMTFPKTSEFPNMPLDAVDRRFMAMPAYLGGRFHLAGQKWYGSNIENRKYGLPRSILMVTLNDKDSGAPIAYMSGNLLSAYRTGAIPGVGTKYLARKDSQVLGIYGPGVMAKTALEAFVCTCPNLCELKIKGRGRASIDKFIENVKKKYPQFQKIEVVGDTEELVKGSDIVCFAATAGKKVEEFPYVDEKWIKKGALFCAPAAVNFSEDLLIRKCTKVVDYVGLYDAWFEETGYPSFGEINIIGAKYVDLVHAGKIDRSDIRDMGAILSGKVPGRTSEDEIIVYSVGGMPVEDIAWGKDVYDNAKKQGLGTELLLWDEPYIS